MVFFNPDVAVDAVAKTDTKFLCKNCDVQIPLGTVHTKEDEIYLYIRCIFCNQLCRIEKANLPK